METEINIQEIVDYSICPMMYYYKYVVKLSSEVIDMSDKYLEDLLKVIFYSYYIYKSNEIIKLENVKQIWGKLWIKDRRKSKVIFVDSFTSKDYYNTKRVKGLQSLLKFRERMIKENEYPVLVNQEYKFKIDDIIIKGRFEVVTEKDNILKIKTFKTSEVSRVPFMHDIKLNCDHLALENLLEQKLDVINSIYYIEKDKTIDKKSNDISKKLLIHNIKTITKLINNKIFYSSVSEHCIRCKYRDRCATSNNKKMLLYDV